MGANYASTAAARFRSSNAYIQSKIAAFTSFLHHPNDSAGPAPVRFDCMRRFYDGHLTVDFATQAAMMDSEPLVLTRKEFELLAALVQNAGEVVRRDELMQGVWGYSKETRTRTLDVHIRHLRRKLGTVGDRYIETIFGVGYRFQPGRPARPVTLTMLPATA